MFNDLWGGRPTNRRRGAGGRRSSRPRSRRVDLGVRRRPWTDPVIPGAAERCRSSPLPGHGPHAGLRSINPSTERRRSRHPDPQLRDPAWPRSTMRDGTPLEMAPPRWVPSVEDRGPSGRYDVDDLAASWTPDRARGAARGQHPPVRRAPARPALPAAECDRDHEPGDRRERRPGGTAGVGHRSQSTRISVAPEIAQANPPAAGERRGDRPQDLAEGGVGMVELALAKPRSARCVEVDQERRAPWSPTCWWSCAASRTPSPSATPSTLYEG